MIAIAHKYGLFLKITLKITPKYILNVFVIILFTKISYTMIDKID